MENSNVAGDIDTAGEAVTEMGTAAHDINYWSGLLFQVSRDLSYIMFWPVLNICICYQKLSFAYEEYSDSVFKVRQLHDT